MPLEAPPTDFRKVGMSQEAESPQSVFSSADDKLLFLCVRYSLLRGIPIHRRRKLDISGCESSPEYKTIYSKLAETIIYFRYTYRCNYRTRS
jgi:hypothetical protein